MHPACTAPGCARTPDVCVEYVPGKPRDLRPALLPSVHGLVTLCDWHAAELPAALGAGRVLGVTRLE